MCQVCLQQKQSKGNSAIPVWIGASSQVTNSQIGTVRCYMKTKKDWLQVIKQISAEPVAIDTVANSRYPGL